MAILTIEITDDMKQYVDRQIGRGTFKDSSAVVQALLDVAIRAEQRAVMDKHLCEAIEEVERGECAPWNPDEDRKLLEELMRQRRASTRT